MSDYALLYALTQFVLYAAAAVIGATVVLLAIGFAVFVIIDRGMDATRKRLE